MIALMAATVFSSALALDDLITSGVSFPHCTELIVPVLLYTMPGGDDLPGFAELLENEQNIWFTGSHYYPWEYKSIGVLVDLLQAFEGGRVSVTVLDHREKATWTSIVSVPSLDPGSDIERHVVVVQIPEPEISSAFPHSGIYQIVATSAPKEVDGPECGSSASTSIIVERP
jgi:hypothetical protein